jgi:hypothetical protein
LNASTLHNFESTDTFLPTFIKTYDTISQSRIEDIQKFYAPYATVLRQQGASVCHPGSGLAHEQYDLGIHQCVKLTIIGFTLTQIRPHYYVSVRERIQRRRSRVGFTELFVLAESGGRFWITARLVDKSPGDAFDVLQEPHPFATAH